MYCGNMVRCFVDPGLWNEKQVVLPPDEAHHLLHVLRVRAGDIVTVFDGRGRSASARVAASGTSAVLDIVETRERASSRLALVLVQALVREQKMDYIVQHATELGVSAIVPVAVGNSVVRLSESQRAVRRERWQRIAVSSAKQCGTEWVPEIRPVADFEKALPECAGLDALLIGTLVHRTEPIRQAIGSIRGRNASTVGIMIGPEGDFTPAEVAAAVSVGALPVGLGDLVLRSETAAMYALSVLRYELT